MFTRIDLHAPGVRSLCFRGDQLVDWVGGGAAYALDGTLEPRAVSYAYRFDAAVSSADGRYAVIYERLGTKGLLLDHGRIVRELGRSFYHAEAYEYPICFLTLPDERLVLAHCPDAYNQIELDDVASGKRLTASDQRKPDDFFHSRLSANPSGTRLLSAGWVWHPWDAVVYFDVAAALADPRTLDALDWSAPSARNVSLTEESSAAWQTDDCVLLGGGTEPEDPTEAAEHPGTRLHPRGIAVFDVLQRACLAETQLAEPPGTMMAVGHDHVVTFFGHPRLIALASGNVIHEWLDIDSGTQTSSIIWHKPPPPPLCLDARNARFAVAHGDSIAVIQIDRDALARL